MVQQQRRRLDETLRESKLNLRTVAGRALSDSSSKRRRQRRVVRRVLHVVLTGSAIDTEDSNAGLQIVVDRLHRAGQGLRSSSGNRTTHEIEISCAFAEALNEVQVDTNVVNEVLALAWERRRQRDRFESCVERAIWR